MDFSSTKLGRLVGERGLRAYLLAAVAERRSVTESLAAKISITASALADRITSGREVTCEEAEIAIDELVDQPDPAYDPWAPTWSGFVKHYVKRVESRAYGIDFYEIEIDGERYTFEAHFNDHLQPNKPSPEIVAAMVRVCRVGGEGTRVFGFQASLLRYADGSEAASLGCNVIEVFRG